MGSKRGAEAAQLGGALAQLEVAEAALRDSQATAGRLLQDCTALQHEKRALVAAEGELRAQLHGALRLPAAWLGRPRLIGACADLTSAKAAAIVQAWTLIH